jgi:nitrate reductase alpha subunit
LAVGTILEALPPAAAPQVYGGQTYYYDGTNYYEACYQGADLDYCVVPNPGE